MAECFEYLELISRSVDGDLSAEEAEKLYEHLAHCPSCSEALSSFEELSMMTADSLKTPPAQLREGVMASITAAKKRPWYVRYRFTAVAACFALVVLAISYTPLGDFLFPTQQNEILTEDAQAPVPTADVTLDAAPSNGANTASTPAPKLRAAETPVEAYTEETATAEAKSAPQAEIADDADTEAVTDQSAEQETKQESEKIDPTLLPNTPYDATFAKYLLFSAKEAPEVLYSITSDQIVDSVVYYIVTAEQFTAVQTALLETGIEVQVVSGDPESEQFLLILTITE